MKRSPQVLVTLVAAMGLAARGQQPVNPCDPASFNDKICKSAVRRGGYCAPDGWTPLTLQKPYPYYYDLYQQHMQAGGVITPAETGKCGHVIFGAHGVSSHGGFGSTGAGHSAAC